MHILILALLLVAVVVILFWLRERVHGNANVHEDMLVRKCFGNKETAERLIDLELKRNPKLKRDTAAKWAIQALVRDNR